MKQYILEDYEPRHVMRYFEEVSRIPRGSGNEDEIAEYILEFADKFGLESYKDEIGNVLVIKPATPGYEHVPPVLFQAHLDMVCVKTPESTHDFLNDPIEFKIVDGDVLYANGTTLGADNAVGISYMMALAASKNVVHPPLELLFTVQEETGLIGMRAFDASKLKSQRMINMDCGDAETLCIGSAGSASCSITKSCNIIPFANEAIYIKIAGLTGGHSGIQIDKGRASAIKLMARLLHRLNKCTKVNIVTMTSDKGESIPKSAECVLSVLPECIDQATDEFKAAIAEIQREYKITDPDMYIDIGRTNGHFETMLDLKSSEEIINLLFLLPQSVTKRYPLNKDVLICSCNTTGVNVVDEFSALFSICSIDDSVKWELFRQVELLCRLCDASISIESYFSGWVPKEYSKFQMLCHKTYKDLFSKDLKTEVIHGGVEPSIILDTIPDMDIIGIAPTATGAHTVEEHLYLSTMKPVWDFFVALLAAMCAE